MRLRLRLSLLARMAVVAGILCSITAMLAVILAILGAFLGFAALGWLYRGVETVAGLPQPSAVLPIPAVAIAAAALVGIVGTVWS